MTLTVIILAIALAVVSLLLLILVRLLVKMKRDFRDIQQQLIVQKSRKQSQSTRYGKMSEQFMPFLSDYPWDPQQFRFLGSPIDGVQFADDKVVFVEFKIGTSRLNARQRQIRNLVLEGKVDFREHRLR